MFFYLGWIAAQGRRSPFLHLSCAALLLFVPVMLARAQGGIDTTGTGGKHRIQGRIYFPSGRRSDAGAVRVVLESSSSEKLSVIADLNGSFTFTSIAPGSYNVTVDAGEDYEIGRDSVYVEGAPRSRTIELARADVPRVFNVIVHLKLKQTAVGNRPAVLNAALAGVPKPAVELYDKAIEAVRTGDTKNAIVQLQAAISYYPEFTIALNELALQYLKTGQPDKATETLRRALRIRPDEFTLLLNYGIALLEKNENTEAEAQLRQAVKKNDSAWQAHMYLGVALISLRNYIEAERELLRTLVLGGDDLSLPHYYLGGLYWGKRDYRRAADELEKYLKLAPKAPDAERTRASIKELRSKQS
ncbi:MAG: tetratricopeptide repeat protein [Pyrinomonadaceae bacterium]